MHTSNHSPRLKAQLLNAAVRDNADVIADRLPPALRPARRRLAAFAYRTRFATVPLTIVATAVIFARWSTAAQPVVVAPPTEAIFAAPSTPSSMSAPDLKLLARPLPTRALQLGVRRVVLDAGHGGAQDGTASASGLLEKHVALDLAERARQLLINRGFEVVLTRTADQTLSLKQRATAANRQRADIFVSIHLNSLPQAGARGVETFYLGPSEHPEHDAVAAAENQDSGYSIADLRTLLDGIYVDARRDESKRLAQSVQKAVVRRLRTIDPTIDDRGVKTAPFVVLVATDMPAVLAEVSCLSNADEAERLATATHRQTIAEALVDGIQAFSKQTTQTVSKRKDTNER